MPHKFVIEPELRAALADGQARSTAQLQAEILRMTGHAWRYGSVQCAVNRLRKDGVIRRVGRALSPNGVVVDTWAFAVARRGVPRAQRKRRHGQEEPTDGNTPASAAAVS